MISDVRMPKMNGYKFCQRIKEVDNDAKICFLTASEDYYYVDNQQKGRKCFIKNRSQLMNW
jgi:CheY-like chemotaxis protein